MYSRNDYRYYLENRLMHSDDYLAHYGVKGMKWKNHKKKVTDFASDAKNSVTDFANDTSIQAKKAGKTVKKNAKKAYKYADDHVDVYGKRLKSENTSYRGAGVRVKTKKSITEAGVYARSDSIKTKKGKKIPYRADVGIDVARDNKKKHKASYKSAGTGVVGPVPVYVYRSRSLKY